MCADKLRDGATTNFFAWRKRVGPQLHKEFGRMAKFLNGTGIEDATIFALPEITESDWIPAGGPDLTAPQKNSLYMDHVKIRTKLTMDFPDKFASMFASLQAETSPKLWAKIESHSKFEVAQQK